MYKSDIEIAQSVTPQPISAIAERVGIPEEYVELYGRNKAKISLDWLETGTRSRITRTKILLTSLGHHAILRSTDTVSDAVSACIGTG